MNEVRIFDDRRTTVAIYSSVITASLGIIYFVSRTGFERHDPVTIFQCAGLSFFVQMLPLLADLSIFARFRSGDKSATLNAAISFIALLLLVVAGFVRLNLDINLLHVFAWCGVLLWGSAFIVWFSRSKKKDNILLMGTAVLTSLALAGFYWGQILSMYSPLFPEALSGGYNLFQDGFISASISAMIQTYGIPSTGLDGLIYCAHHWGTYWFFAGIAGLLDLDMVTFIQMGFPIVFIPFFLARFLTFVVDLRDVISDSSTNWNLRSDLLFWTLFTAAGIGFFPKEVFEGTLANPFFSGVISLTNTFGLTLFFILLSLCLKLVPAFCSEWKVLSFSDRAFICFLPICLVFIGFVKISVLYCLMVIYGYLWLRLRLWRNNCWLFSFPAAVLALFAATLLTTNPGSGSGNIAPLALFVSLVPLSWKPFFFIFHYFWSWVFALCWVYFHRIGTLRELVDSFSDKRTLDLEIVVAVSVLGSVPGMLFGIPGASGSYFTSFQVYVSLSLLLANLGRFGSASNLIQRFRDRAILTGGGTRLKDLGSLFLICCFLISLFANFSLAVWSLVSSNLAVRCSLKTSEGRDLKCDGLDERLGSIIRQNLKRLEITSLVRQVRAELRPVLIVTQNDVEKRSGFKIVQVLRQIGRLPLAEKRQTALWIPKTNRVYWDILPRCEAVPFVAPAITGMAAIDNLPDVNCPYAITPAINHYGVYRRGALAVGEQQMDENNACNAARGKGFLGLIVVDADAEGRIGLKKIDLGKVAR